MKVFADGNIEISNFINEINKNKKLRKQIGLNCRIMQKENLILIRSQINLNEIFHLN